MTWTAMSAPHAKVARSATATWQ